MSDREDIGRKMITIREELKTATLLEKEFERMQT